MPRSTALWLLKNTKLSLKQISDFSSITMVDLHVMKEGFAERSLSQSDPVVRKQLLQSEIERCEQDSTASLNLNTEIDVQEAIIKKIPYALKKYVPGCVLWMNQNYPELEPKQIAKLFSLKVKDVKEIIESPATNISANSPVLNGICSQEYLNRFLKENNNG